MQVKVRDKNVFYAIGWSGPFDYDRISASRILPELPGVIMFYEDTGIMNRDILCYGCWRDGLRMGMKNLMDPIFSKYEYLYENMKDLKLKYKYCVVDTKPQDMKDVMFWLINTYRPILNNDREFKDSGRYDNISVTEIKLKKDEIKVKAPGFGF